MGQLETLQLMNSTVFTEKITGYIALTILFDEQNVENLTRAIEIIKADLQVGQELFQSLALASLANFPLKLFVDKFADIVYGLAFNSNYNSFYVEKRAITCLCTFVRKVPTIYQPTWNSNFSILLQNMNVRVLLATTSLILTCISLHGPVPLISIFDGLLTINFKISNGS